MHQNVAKTRFSTILLRLPQSDPRVSCIPCTNLRGHWHISNASQLFVRASCLFRPPSEAHGPTTPMFVAFSTPKTLVRSFQLYKTRSRGFLRSRVSLKFRGAFS